MELHGPEKERRKALRPGWRQADDVSRAVRKKKAEIDKAHDDWKEAIETAREAQERVDQHAARLATLRRELDELNSCTGAAFAQYQADLGKGPR